MCVIRICICAFFDRLILGAHGFHVLLMINFEILVVLSRAGFCHFYLLNKISTVLGQKAEFFIYF